MKYAAIIRRSVGHYVDVTDFRVFKDKADMEAWVLRTTEQHTLIEYRELTVKRSVSVEVS